MRRHSDAEVRTRDHRRARRRHFQLMLAGLVAVLLLVPLAPSAWADTPSFPDVPSSHPYYTAITSLASKGIIGGFSNGTFGPQLDVTRQQFAKMIVLTCRYPVSEADVCTFLDVQKSDDTSAYPDNYIAVCAARGITTGTSPTTFSPDKKITRYQMVSMVVRAADNLWPGLLADPPAGWTGNSVWAANLTHGANAARAEYNGLLSGLNLASLNPMGNMTRGEVAQVLYNLHNKLFPAMTADFESLGGTLTSSPAACSMVPNMLHVYARGANGHLMQKYWNGKWSDWEDFGGVLKPGTSPAAVSWGPGRIDVFVVGLDDALYHKCWNGSKWSEFENLGGTLTSSPAACSMVANMIHVYARGTNGHLMQKYWNGKWSDWEDMGGITKPGTSPAAVSWGPGRIDVFVVGLDDALYHKCWNGSKWSEFENLGGTLTSSPAACSMVANMIHMYARGTNGHLMQKYWNGKWSDWEDLGGVLLPGTSPAAESWAFGRIDLLIVGTDNALWHQYWNGSSWKP